MCRCQQENTSIAIFPFAIGVVSGCTFADAVNVLLFLPVLAAAYWLNKRYALWCILGALAGVAALSIDTFLYLQRVRELPETSMRKSFVARSCDTRPAFVPGMPLPASFVAEIIRIDGKECSSGIKILVRPGKGYFPRCGEMFSGTGRFVPAESQGPSGKYLRSRKIYGVWYCNQLKTLSPPGGVFYQLSCLRDFLLERVIADMESPVARVIAGMMFFGATGGFDHGLRQVFVDSGTLHLFSVSGMHLAAVYMLLLIPALFIPFRYRCFFLAFFISLYALSTGANPPVLRALIVILLWCAAKAFCFRKSRLELLSLAAAVMFLHNPALVYNIGSQYSFFITLILIFTAERMNGFPKEADMFSRLAPQSEVLLKSRRKSRFCWRILFTLGGCGMAFAASAGISAASGGLILPGTILMNFVLCLFLPVLFLLMGLKLLFGPWMSGAIPEGVLLLLERFCFEGSSYLMPLNMMLVWKYEALIFCILLCCAVGFPNRKIRCISAAVALGVFLLWAVRPDFQKPEIAFISQGSGVPPVIAVAEPREDLGFLVNFSNYDMTEKAVNFLISRGIRRAEAFLFCDEKNASRSVGFAAAALSPRRLRLPDSPALSIRKKIGQIGLKNIANGAREREFIKIFKEKSFYSLEYFNPGSNLSFRIKWCDTPQGRKVEINGVPLRSINWSNSLEVICYEF